jgi:hypothetical protein
MNAARGRMNAVVHRSSFIVPRLQKAVSCPSMREVGTSDHAPVVATFA